MGLFTSYAWIHFWNFERIFLVDEIEFGKEESSVGTTPIAIKSINWWFWRGRGFSGDCFSEGERNEARRRDLRPHTSGDFPAGRRALPDTFVIDSFIPIILLLSIDLHWISSFAWILGFRKAEVVRLLALVLDCLYDSCCRLSFFFYGVP